MRLVRIALIALLFIVSSSSLLIAKDTRSSRALKEESKPSNSVGKDSPTSGTSGAELDRALADADNESSGNLFWNFFGIFFWPLCHEHQDGSYETKQVFFLLTWLHLIFDPSYLWGSCCEAVPNMCGANAECLEDVCTCLPGYTGDAIQGCTNVTNPPSPESSSPPSDFIDVNEFIEATFVPGLTNEVKQDREETNGDLFDIKTNLTIAESGVLALAQEESVIEGITCIINDDESASIVVRFSGSIDEDSAAAMFPNGTVVEIDGDVFGSCVVTPPDDDNPVDPELLEVQDGYLVVEEAILLQSGNEVEVRGSPTSFFFLFDEGHIHIDLVDDAGERRRQLVSLGSFSKKIGSTSALLQAFVSAGLNLHARFHSFDADWSWRHGLTLSFLFDTELTGEIMFGLDFFKGTYRKAMEDYPFFELPIPNFSIPRLNILDTFDLKQPRLGAYIDVRFFWEYALTTAWGWSLRQTYTATTGLKQFKVWANGGWSGLSAGIDTIKDEPASTNAEYQEDIVNMFRIEFDGKTGIKSGIYIDIFGILGAGVYQRTFAHLHAIGTTDGLSPPPDESLGLITLGDCDSCHSVELDVDFVLENISVEAYGKFVYRSNWCPFGADWDWCFVSIDAGFHKSHTFPGELRADLLTACIFERDNMFPCQETCCFEDALCIQGGCYSCDPACIPNTECVALTGTDVTCQDNDECAQPGVCGPFADCSNWFGGYDCTCWQGYQGNPPSVACTEVNECAESPGPCGPHSSCTDTPGSFTCQCLGGFEGDPPALLCTDIDECLDDPCGEHADCHNRDGGFDCTCHEGYVDNPPDVSCSDRNECTEGNPCGDHSLCINTDGSFLCECLEGYQGDPPACEDENECSHVPNPCGDHADCTNTDGSFDCECQEGFQGVPPDEECTVENPCDPAFDPCGEHSICSVENGSVTCYCLQGFEGNPPTDLCEDEDECSPPENPCGSYAVCTNTEGSFDCACEEGYDGNPPTSECTWIDPCDPNPCGPFSMCNVTSYGAADCSCIQGYEGTPPADECEDTDECAAPENPCGENADCTNTDGSFDCVCEEGFNGYPPEVSCIDLGDELGDFSDAAGDVASAPDLLRLQIWQSGDFFTFAITFAGPLNEFHAHVRVYTYWWLWNDLYISFDDWQLYYYEQGARRNFARRKLQGDLILEGTTTTFPADGPDPATVARVQVDRWVPRGFGSLFDRCIEVNRYSGDHMPDTVVGCYGIEPDYAGTLVTDLSDPVGDVALSPDFVSLQVFVWGKLVLFEITFDGDPGDLLVGSRMYLYGANHHRVDLLGTALTAWWTLLRDEDEDGIYETQIDTGELEFQSSGVGRHTARILMFRHGFDEDVLDKSVYVLNLVSNDRMPDSGTHPIYQAP